MPEGRTSGQIRAEIAAERRLLAADTAALQADARRMVKAGGIGLGAFVAALTLAKAAFAVARHRR